MRVRRGGTAAGLMAGAVAVLALAGCSHGSDEPPHPSPPPNTTTASAAILDKPNAKLKVKLKELGGGDFTRKQRARIERKLTRPIASWINGGFLRGPYPRHDFDAAFAHWTDGARRLGQHDRRVTTNASLGSHLTGIVADRQTAGLYVFAYRHRTGGATAHVGLGFTGARADGTFVHLAVTGRLYLTNHHGHWVVFGYDLHRKERG